MSSAVPSRATSNLEERLAEGYNVLHCPPNLVGCCPACRNSQKGVLFAAGMTGLFVAFPFLKLIVALPLTPLEWVTKKLITDSTKAERTPVHAVSVGHVGDYRLERAVGLARAQSKRFGPGVFLGNVGARYVSGVDHAHQFRSRLEPWHLSPW